MSRKFVFGIDFGTLSARAVLVDVEDGSIRSTAVSEFAHGVIDTLMPDGKTKLPPDWALQHPQDYLDAMATVIPLCLQQGNVSPDDVIGIGTDFTECTMIPIKRDGTPLCFLSKFADHPHAYVKLWKHHGTQNEADKLNRIAKERNEEFLSFYGGKVSSEWLFPKIMQVLTEAPEIFAEADEFIEAADWITLVLTGEEKRNSCTAGFKALWQKQKGFPSSEFFKALDPRLENIVEDKLASTIYPVGSRCGFLTDKMAERIGLNTGTPVAVGSGDGHTAVAGSGIMSEGIMLMCLGTSGSDMLLHRSFRQVPGICGICEDGIMPGFFGYEAGQSCIGDHFSWFARTCAPPDIVQAAAERGLTVLEYLNKEASKIEPGATGLIALDWWNGNRSTLVDSELSGLIVGMTLTTTPIHIYKALVEAVAYGKRMIIENFINHGIEINELYATGGISEKSPFILQTFADVINMEVKVVKTQNATAMGSAVFGAVAAGKEFGGYDSINEAVSQFSSGIREIFVPNERRAEIYDKLYQEYEKLYQTYGLNDNMMKNLREIKRNAQV